MHIDTCLHPIPPRFPIHYVIYTPSLFHLLLCPPLCMRLFYWWHIFFLIYHVIVCNAVLLLCWLGKLCCHCYFCISTAADPETIQFWPETLAKCRLWTLKPEILIFNPWNMKVLDLNPGSMALNPGNMEVLIQKPENWTLNPLNMQVSDPKTKDFEPKPLKNAGFRAWGSHFQITAPLRIQYTYDL